MCRIAFPLHEKLTVVAGIRKHEDISTLFEVRVATRENALSLSDLEKLGITEETIHSAIDDSHCGWLVISS